MKKLFNTLFILGVLGFAGYYIYINYFGNAIPKVDVEEKMVEMNIIYMVII